MDTQSGMCQVALNAYSLLIFDDYVFMAARRVEGGFNSISFSGNLFFKSQ